MRCITGKRDFPILNAAALQEWATTIVQSPTHPCLLVGDGNEHRDPQWSMCRVRDFRVLSPRWDVFTQVLPLNLRDLSRGWGMKTVRETDRLDDFNETASYTCVNRTVTHRNAQRLWQHAQVQARQGLRSERVKWTRSNQEAICNW